MSSQFHTPADIIPEKQCQEVYARNFEYFFPIGSTSINISFSLFEEDGDKSSNLNVVLNLYYKQDAMNEVPIVIDPTCDITFLKFYRKFIGIFS